MPSGDAHRSLARALDILELCSLNGSGYTLTQLSQHLGIATGSRTMVRNPVTQGWYPNSGSYETGVPYS